MSGGTGQIPAVSSPGGSGDMLKADNLAGLASYAAARLNMGLVIGSDVQAAGLNLQKIYGGTFTGTSKTLSSSLNGDVDGTYLIIFRFKCAAPNSTGIIVDVRPNGLATNQFGYDLGISGGGTVGAGAKTTMRLCTNNGTGGQGSVSGFTILHARTGVNRAMVGAYAGSAETGGWGGWEASAFHFMTWQDPTTNLTEITLVATTGGWGAGSGAELYKFVP